LPPENFSPKLLKLRLANVSIYWPVTLMRSLVTDLAVYAESSSSSHFDPPPHTHRTETARAIFLNAL